MIQNRAVIAPDVAEVLKALNGNRSLQRAAFAGVPFAVTYDEPEPCRARTRFPEALVLSMIEQGFLYATQQAQAWPERGVPARPFAVRLSKDGEKERVRLLNGVTTVANDDATLSRAA